MGQERDGVFGRVNTRRTDPIQYLAELFLGNLSDEEKVKRVTSVLVETCLQDDKTILFLEALERLFDKYQVAFRAHLREVYSKLPLEVEVGYHWGGTCNETRILEIDDAAPKLKAAMLGRILSGWRFENWQDPPVPEEAEACFDLVCQAFESAREGGKVRSGILDIFREHTKLGWEAREFNPLDRWILRDSTPLEIVQVLLMARTRLDSGGTRKEAYFLEPFLIKARSEEALELARESLVLIRRNEDLVVQLIGQIRHHNHVGDLNPTRVLPNAGEATYHLVSATSARLKITFRDDSRVPIPPRDREYLRIITEVQTARDRLLNEVVNPPTILIEAVGPDNFHWAEG